MAQKLKRTLRGVGYAPVTQTIATDGTITETRGTPTWLPTVEAGGRAYTADPRGETSSIEADGITVFSADENDGYDIKLTLLSIVDDVCENWLGNTVDTNGGVAEYANGLPLPIFDLFLIEDTSDGTE